MCSAPSAEENKIAPKTFPQQLLINESSDGCPYQVLPYIDGHDMGFLTINCRMSCPAGIQKTDVNGNPCVANWSYLDPATSIRVQEGLCDKGFCNPRDPPKDHTIALEEEEEEENEGEQEGDEEGEKRRRTREKGKEKKTITTDKKKYLE
uniref:Evasin n=1 Tax=Ixodes ricinus TaxID=34613 RepID=A0A0K8RA72_IXORI